MEELPLNAQNLSFWTEIIKTSSPDDNFLKFGYTHCPVFSFVLTRDLQYKCNSILIKQRFVMQPWVIKKDYNQFN